MTVPSSWTLDALVEAFTRHQRRHARSASSDSAWPRPARPDVRPGRPWRGPGRPLSPCACRAVEAIALSKTQGRHGARHRCQRELAVVDQVQLVGPDVLGTEQLGRLPVVAGEFRDQPKIRGLRLGCQVLDPQGEAAFLLDGPGCAVRAWRQADRRRAGRRDRGARSAHDARTGPDGRATRSARGRRSSPVRSSARRACTPMTSPPRSAARPSPIHPVRGDYSGVRARDAPGERRSRTS